MKMHWRARYSTSNEVVELEQDRRIAWRTKAPAPMDKLVTGRTWRYELAPADEGTMVTETWDISTEAALARPVVRRLASTTRRNMERTLARIDELLTKE